MESKVEETYQGFGDAIEEGCKAVKKIALGWSKAVGIS